MSDIESAFKNFLHKRENQNLKRQLQVVSRETSRHISVCNKEYINFSGNDYLGLTFHPDIIKAIQNGVQEYGAGANASRLITGNLDIYARVENKIAAFKQKDAALVMVSGYQTNASVLPALFDSEAYGKSPLVFADKLIHASMHMGCKAAGVMQIRFRHNDMDHLKSLLEKHQDSDQPKFILTETVFSMDGDIAPMDDLRRLADKYNVFLIADEAHATGVFGTHGEGLGHQADLVIGTFGKAFGVFGAYVACSTIIKEYLVNKCGGLIYATALPPCILSGIEAALDIVPTMGEQREYLQTLSALLNQGLKKMGYDTAQSQSQIVPMILRDAGEALAMSDMLKSKGFWVGAVRPPTVPIGQSRLRFAINTTHKEQDIHQVLEAIAQHKMMQAA